MPTVGEKLAKMLRTSPEAILSLDAKLSALSGQSGVLERLVREIDAKIDAKLTRLGLTRQTPAGALALALGEEIIGLEKQLLAFTGGTDLAPVGEKARQLVNPGPGFFLKPEKALALLRANPPQSILAHFGYRTADELVEKEGLEAVYSALRFIEPGDWMNSVFIKGYDNLTAGDFETRPVKIIVLDAKWLAAAEKFLRKKYHNVSHLKELGVIFIIPLPIDTAGELLRVFTLLLHYLNEVPFYSGLFKRFAGETDFPAKLMSLLRGDVPLTQPPTTNRQQLMIMIIQRYLAKDDQNDPRLFVPHVNPEAEHWYKAQVSLSRLNGFEKIMDYDFVGGYFPSAAGEELVSFDLVDLTMSLVKQEMKYLYHQQEALWNKIFIEYLGRGRMNQLIEENIISGFITL